MTTALLAALALGIVAAAPAPRVEFIAHRGESADAPENTLAAFRLAWERHDTAIELDTHLTSDGKLVVSHDGNTKRTTGVDKVIKDTPLAELEALDAGKWKGAQFAGEKLPTLLSALETIPDKCRCFIEIKCGPEAVPELVRVIKQSGKKPSQLVLISFSADALAAAKRALPRLRAYYLASTRRDPETGEWSPSVEDLIARAKDMRIDGLDLAMSPCPDAAFVREVRNACLGLYAWTVDDPEMARRLVAAGVDGITSNRPARLREQLQPK